MSSLGVFLALGFLGSAHCAGMCGPLALSTTCDERGGARPWVRVLCYALGKALTYALLCAVAASATSLVALEPARPALALLAGASMVAFALSALGLIRVPSSQLAWLGPRWLTFPARAARSLDGYARSFGLGLANGLLPCGLSWSAFALAAASEPALAAAGGFAFGLATSPVLAAIGLAGRAVPLRARATLVRVAAVLVLGLGAWTLVRAPAAWIRGEPVPECCSPEGAETGALASETVTPAPSGR